VVLEGVGESPHGIIPSMLGCTPSRGNEKSKWSYSCLAYSHHDNNVMRLSWDPPFKYILICSIISFHTRHLLSLESTGDNRGGSCRTAALSVVFLSKRNG